MPSKWDYCRLATWGSLREGTRWPTLSSKLATETHRQAQSRNMQKGWKRWERHAVQDKCVIIMLACIWQCTQSGSSFRLVKCGNCFYVCLSISTSCISLHLHLFWKKMSFPLYCSRSEVFYNLPAFPGVAIKTTIKQTSMCLEVLARHYIPYRYLTTRLVPLPPMPKNIILQPLLPHVRYIIYGCFYRKMFFLIITTMTHTGSP